MRTVWALSVVHTYVRVCVCSGGACWAELQSAGNSLLLQSMWLTVCGREGNCWSMPVVTRAFRGADVEQTEAHRTHREGAGSPELMTHLSQTIPSCLFTLLFCSLSKWVRVLTDKGLSPSDWAVLKDFTCLDFRTSGLFRSRSASRVNSLQNWQTLSFYLLHWERESVVSASTNRAPKINCQMLSFLFIVDTILLKVYALLSINELALRWTPLRSVPSFLIYPQ